ESLLGPVEWSGMLAGRDDSRRGDVAAIGVLVAVAPEGEMVPEIVVGEFGLGPRDDIASEQADMDVAGRLQLRDQPFGARQYATFEFGKHLGKTRDIGLAERLPCAERRGDAMSLEQVEGNRPITSPGERNVAGKPLH